MRSSPVHMSHASQQPCDVPPMDGGGVEDPVSFCRVCGGPCYRHPNARGPDPIYCSSYCRYKNYAENNREKKRISSKKHRDAHPDRERNRTEEKRATNQKYRERMRRQKASIAQLKALFSTGVSNALDTDARRSSDQSVGEGTPNTR